MKNERTDCLKEEKRWGGDRKEEIYMIDFQVQGDNDSPGICTYVIRERALFHS